MKKNITMTITRINSDPSISKKDNFIKDEDKDYEFIKKEFVYNNEVIIKDLNFILNLFLNAIQKYKLIIIILILLVFLLLFYLKR
jgi:hypothetical protein